MSYDKIYQKLRKQFSDEEIAGANMIPADLTQAEEEANREELRRIRFERLKNMTEDQKIYSDVLRLRFEIESYLNFNRFDESKTFGIVLSEYIRAVRKTKKDFASDIGLHYSRLSRILKDKESPNVELIYRLEKHSGNLIPAVDWWKVMIKKLEYELITNELKRQEEGRKVQNPLPFRA